MSPLDPTELLFKTRAELRRTSERLREAESLPAERLRLLLLNIEPAPSHVHFLLARADASDPCAAIDNSRLALAQAERLDDGPLVVESLCELGNAYRRHGELHRAGEALRAARAQSLLEPLDPLAEAHLHTLLASYFSQRRDYRRALRHCRRALRTYASVGQHNDALTTQIQLAFLLTEGDRAGEGLRVAEAAWSAARVRGHHRAALQAVHNVVYAMVELGENGRALAMLADAAPLYRALAAPRERTLARWLEARAHRGAGDPLRAAGLLRRVCDELAELDLGYELVMCQLHLALACRDAGLWTQLRSTCREAAPLASALGIEDACLAAWRLDSQYGAGG